MGVHSVFSTLLHRNDKAAEVILDNHITTNGQELDSSNLLIIYDLKIFNPEAKHELAVNCTPHFDSTTLDNEMKIGKNSYCSLLLLELQYFTFQAKY